MKHASKKQAVIWGFGGLGRSIARSVLADTGGLLEIIGIVDTSEKLVGRPAAEFVPGLPEGLMITPAITAGSGILFHSTESNVTVVEGQILQGIAAGYDVMTAAEWMFYPWLLYGDVAARIEHAARAAGRRVLGCGINPGFAFDMLPLVFARTLSQVKTIEMTRISNVSGSGRGDFKHVGFALPADVFRQRLREGSIKGHIGFPESIAAIAERSGLQIDHIIETWSPIPAVRVLQLPQATIEIGDVVGIRQEATGLFDGQVRLRMVLEMHLDPDGYGRKVGEQVIIEADSTVTLTVTPAARSAAGAGSVMAGAALDLDAAEPGIVCFLDLPLGGTPRVPHRLLAGVPTWHEETCELQISPTA